MLIETAISAPDGSLVKVQYALEDIRRHQAGPGGRSRLTFRTGSQFATGADVQTWEQKSVLDARLLTLSLNSPVALMSQDDWNAAVEAHGA